MSRSAAVTDDMLVMGFTVQDNIETRDLATDKGQMRKEILNVILNTTEERSTTASCEDPEDCVPLPIDDDDIDDDDIDDDDIDRRHRSRDPPSDLFGGGGVISAVACPFTKDELTIIATYLNDHGVPYTKTKRDALRASVNAAAEARYGKGSQRTWDAIKRQMDRLVRAMRNDDDEDEDEYDEDEDEDSFFESSGFESSAFTSSSQSS